MGAMIGVVAAVAVWILVSLVNDINDTLKPKDKKSKHKPNHWIMQRKITRKFFRW